jgi:predicted PolB exonuclease-like 3'-5' exonuclease
VAHAECDYWVVDALGAPHVGDRTEKQLISAFVGKIADLSPQLVTFNGNSFDLPVLRYRAMIHAVAAPGLAGRAYFSRYTEDALDLCDVLASFNPGARATLNEIARIMRWPGKPDGIDGGQVDKYFRDGKIKEIAEYCETDVANTYRVWLRYELFRWRSRVLVAICCVSVVVRRPRSAFRHWLQPVRSARRGRWRRERPRPTRRRTIFSTARTGSVSPGASLKPPS